MHDCRDNFPDMMRHCKVYNCMNECTGHEECFVEFEARDGQDGRVDCETFYEHMEDMDDHDDDHDDHDNHDDHDDDEECEIMEAEYDCVEMASEYVEFLDECTFVEKYDTCSDEVLECHVAVKVYGEHFEGDCQEVAEMFGVPLDDLDEECEVTCMEPFPCHDESPYEWCEMVECYDHCYEESVCYAEWTDMNGEYQSEECGDFHHEEECDKNGREEDKCDYEQCDMKDGGDCWIETCNMEAECAKPTCTKWMYDERRNYWTAEDCMMHDKDDDMDIGQFFHHTVNFISHYDDTFMLIAEHVFDISLGDMDLDVEDMV